MNLGNVITFLISAVLTLYVLIFDSFPLLTLNLRHIKQQNKALRLTQYQIHSSELRVFFHKRAIALDL